MVHQRINRLIEQGILTGIKLLLMKKSWLRLGIFGITLNKDQDSDRIIEELKSLR
jgi:Lrp/AsnC family transcriptional regulator for asnA, asnC and gidA